MKLRVSKANKKSGSYRVYLPKHIGEEYEGDTECIANALTLTIIRPGTSLEQVKKSLDIVKRDIELRIEQQSLDKAS